MVSVRATFDSTSETIPGTATSSPAVWPTWSARDVNFLYQAESPFGHQAIWSSRSSVHRALSTDVHTLQTCPPALVFFPPCGAKPYESFSELAALKDNSSSPSLCAAANGTVFVSTPSGDDVQSALPCSRRITHLFPLVTGLLVEVSREDGTKKNYYYLVRPLDFMIEVQLPAPDQKVVYTSSDLPLLVSRDGHNVYVWTMQESDESLNPRKPKESEADELTTTIANFVRTARESAIDMRDVSSRKDESDEVKALPTRRILQLQKVYQISVRMESPLSAFLAHDLRGQLVFCLCVSGELHGLSFAMEGTSLCDVSPSFRIRDVSSAGSVLALRQHQNCLDILVRHASGEMSLFMGRNRLCTVLVDPPLDGSPSPYKKWGTGSLAIVGTVGHLFGLSDDSGFITRYSLRSAAFSSPLVNTCLDAISFQLEASGLMLRMTTIYHDILRLCATDMTGDGVSDVDDSDWAVLSSAILQSSSSAIRTSSTVVDDLMDSEPANLESLAEQQNGEEHWKTLQYSELHTRRKNSRLLGPPLHDRIPSPNLGAEQVDLQNIDVDVCRHVLQALHLVYEDQKLYPLSRNACRQLRALNVQLAKRIGAINYLDHYRRDLEAFEMHLHDGFQAMAYLELLAVPSIMDYLADLVKGQGGSDRFLTMDPTALQQTQCKALMARWRGQSPADLSRKVTRYFRSMFGSNTASSTSEERAERILLEMVEDNFCRLDLEALPFGIALPLQDALLTCRQNPSNSWPYAAFALIGREDFSRLSDLDRENGATSSGEVERFQEDQALLQIEAKAAALTQNGDSLAVVGDVDSSEFDQGYAEHTTEGCADGCNMYGMLFRLRFCSDRRSDEVRRILRSTDPVVMTPPLAPRSQSNVDFDAGAEQKLKLDILVRKRFASPVGRGAYTLRTFVPSDPTKPLAVPKICTNGVIFAQKGSKVTHSPQDEAHLQWGEFHNGVAAGLRIAAAGEDRESESSQILTRSWIVNHRPADATGSANHAGMLLALGLGGYLPALRATDYYEYLVPRHDLTSIGLMLGLASGNMGSMDDKVTKMLCVHIKYFNGPGFAVPDFHVPVNVQTAAILGLGLLHQGSCEHLIIEGLFAELGRRPRPGDNIDDREGLALAAGISIGLVCLGNGSSAFDASDRSLVDRLVLYGNGGPGDCVDMTSSSFRSLSIKSDVSGHDRAGLTSADSEASRIREGSFINMDVVSPGALLALALIYLKTNDKRVAQRILVPDSLYSLDRSRPDHVFLRILAKSLILWDEIESSEEWVLSTLPTLLRPVSSPDKSETFDMLGKILAGSMYRGQDVDVNGILQARAFGMAGACTAVALRFAGTGNSEAIKTIFKICESFEKAVLQQEKEKEHVSWVFTTCLCSSALALSIVASGSGDLSIFRLFRRLRKRRSRQTRDGRYGYHLGIHLAIGFLFLGGGCQTFGTSNTAIAGLLCSIYPRFPRDIPDNQFHLQAFRHLYVLATEPRCIEARDVDTGEPCCVDVEVLLKSGNCLKRRAPCIVPEAEQVQAVSVVGERYWPTTVAVNPAIPGKGWFSITKRQVLFVKRRIGHLPYSVDPKGSKSMIARSLFALPPQTGNSSTLHSQVDHLVKAFSADADVLAFVEYFCSSGGNALQDGADSADDNRDRYAEILYECLSNDKPEAVKAYVNAEASSRALLNGRGNPSALGGLVIADAYVHFGQIFEKSLLKPTYLLRLIRNVTESLDSSAIRRALVEYICTGGRTWPGLDVHHTFNRDLSSDFGIMLRLRGIPSPGQMGGLSGQLKRIIIGKDDILDPWLHFSTAGLGPKHAAGLESVLDALEKEMLVADPSTSYGKA